MKLIKIILAIVLLAAIIYWLWTGNNEFLPYVMLTVAVSMLLNTYEEFSKSWKSLDGYFALAGLIIFGSYGIALLFT